MSTEDIKVAVETAEKNVANTDKSTATAKKHRTNKTPDVKVSEPTETADGSSIGDVSGDVTLGVYRINPENTFELKFQTGNAACFDLAGFFKEGDRIKVYQRDDVLVERKVTDNGLVIHNGERALIPTGFIFDIPEGYCLELYARSGTSLKLGVVLNNPPAQIDSDYVNETYISIANTGAAKYLNGGERIAQAKLVRLIPTRIVELDKAPSQKTDRVGGLGSTGK